MTELLNPAQTNITRSASSHTSEVFGSVTPRTNDAPTSLPSHPTDSHGAQRGTTVHSQGVDLAVESLSVEDIRGLSTRHLRILANRAYQLLDTDYPATGVIEGYELIVGELDVRAQQATNRGYVPQLRETFRDNPLYGRFELLIDGTLAVYVRYTMKAGRVVLTDGVEHPGVRDQGMDMTLMRHIVLNAHKRRLSLIPQCPMAFSFLADHPQYQALTARPTH
jgi:predicted GNAT family acetyltransferase